jgi:signal transduction histidine kinase
LKSLENSEKYNLTQRIPSDLIIVSYNYITRNDTINSLNYAKKALVYSGSMREDTKHNLFSTLIEIYKLREDKEKCYVYLDSLNNLSIKERPQYGSVISKSTHDVYKYFNDHDLAYIALDEYFNFETQKKQIEQNETINELETKYNTELKDIKIKRLTSLLILASSLLFLGLLIFYLFRLRKVKDKNIALKEAIKQQLSLEKELMNVRNNIAQDFHDDLGNKLARISFLSRLIEDELPESNSDIKTKVTQVKEDTISLYVGTKDFIFSLKPNSDYLEEVVTYLSDFGEDYFSDTQIQFILDKNINLNKKLPHYWSKQLIFIFKEAMTNAYKHSECDTLTLQFEEKNEILTISCSDNGIGMKKDEVQSKNGISNMAKRAKKIEGKIDVITSNDKGTTIRFTGKLN